MGWIGAGPSTGSAQCARAAGTTPSFGYLSLGAVASSDVTALFQNLLDGLGFLIKAHLYKSVWTLSFRQRNAFATEVNDTSRQFPSGGRSLCAPSGKMSRVFPVCHLQICNKPHNSQDFL